MVQVNNEIIDNIKLHGGNLNIINLQKMRSLGMNPMKLQSIGDNTYHNMPYVRLAPEMLLQPNVPVAYNMPINADAMEKNDSPKIDLSNIEEIILPNNKHFIKYTDPRTHNIVMLEYNNSTISFVELFNTLQMMSKFFQSGDAFYNAQNIFKMQQNSVMKVMLLIPFDQLSNYSQYIGGSKPEQRQAVSYFVEHRKDFETQYGIKLKYLNVDECFALDEDGKVITCYFKPGEKLPDLKVAGTIRTEENSQALSENVNGYFDDDYYESAIEYVEEYNKPMEVDGIVIDASTLETMRNNPDYTSGIEPGKKKNIMDRLNGILIKRKLNPPKVNIKKVQKKPPIQEGYISKIMIVSLSGFAVGMIITWICLLLIKIFFK